MKLAIVRFRTCGAVSVLTFRFNMSLSFEKNTSIERKINYSKSEELSLNSIQLNLYSFHLYSKNLNSIILFPWNSNENSHFIFH